MSPSRFTPPSVSAQSFCAAVMIGCLGLALVLSATPSMSQQGDALTVGRVLELLQQGTPPDALVARVRDEGGGFDLTIEDVVRLSAAGAPAELIRLMARGAPVPEQVEERPLAPAAEPGPDALTVSRVVKMFHKAVPPDEIVAEIARKGIAQPPDLNELLDLRSQGLPDALLRALAGGSPGASGPAPVAATGVAEKGAPLTPLAPLATSDVIKLLQRGKEPDAIVSEITNRGIRSAPTLSEVVSLRKAGATDQILAAINDALTEEPPAEEETAPEPTPAPTAGVPATFTPPGPGEDRVLITSVPFGARVYVAPLATRMAEAFRHDYLVGRTPLTLSLPPGDYRVIVEKEAGEFESGLVPAWRTLHDLSSTRTLLDNADLTFDPANCCLPGTLTGMVEVHSVPTDLPKGIIGDRFDGLAPYLFDGESLQIMQVRRTRITRVLKAYRMRKNAGQSRLLVATFIPAEGDPLDQATVAGLPDGTPFDAYVDAEALEYLARPADMAALAAALGVQPEHLADGVTMLRRAGKAILHQQIPGGLRLLTLALDDDGRLRVTDQTVRPFDPLAPEPPARSKKKKTLLPPPLVPLPQVEREVVPGLGLPRLVIDNKSAQGFGLLLSDGEMCFVPGRTTHEFVMDPGSFDAWLLHGAQPKLAVQGPVHFSYHARYTMVIP